MKATITVEVPDEFLHQRVVEFKADINWSESERAAATPESYFREMVEGICDDELPMAFFGWPLEVTMQIVGE